MSRRVLIVLAVLSIAPTIAPAVALAQRSGGGPAVQSTAPREGAQFAFLVGQWDVTVTPKVSSLAAKIHGAPKFQGTWKAWRAFDGFGIEDELRIADRSGNPSSLSHTMRYFDATKGRWTQTMLDVYRGRFATAEGTWTSGAMVLTGQGTDPEGKPMLTRSRFFDITPSAFTYQADRSLDGGRSWETAIVRIDAKRVASTAPR